MVKRVPQPRKRSCSPRGRSGCPWVSTGVQAGLPTTAAIQELYWCQQSSRAHQADRMTSARLELQNPQTSLTLLNQLSFTTVKQLQRSTATQSLVAERVPKSTLPRSNMCWKTTRLQQPLESYTSCHLPNFKLFGKGTRKVKQETTRKIVFSLTDCSDEHEAQWSFKLSTDRNITQRPWNPAPMGSLSMPVAQHAATSPSSKPNSMEQVADQSNQVITCRSFLWIMYPDCTIAILCIARQRMAAVANNKFHSWYEWVWHRSSMSSIAWARRKSCCRRPGW